MANPPRSHSPVCATFVALVGLLAASCISGDEQTGVEQPGTEADPDTPVESDPVRMPEAGSLAGDDDIIFVPARPECLHVEAPGSCSDSTTRYRFDEASGKCVAFEYSGCGGNENNFLSELGCELYCSEHLDCRCEGDDCDADRCQACPLNQEGRLAGHGKPCSARGFQCFADQTDCTCTPRGCRRAALGMSYTRAVGRALRDPHSNDFAGSQSGKLRRVRPNARAIG